MNKILFMLGFGLALVEGVALQEAHKQLNVFYSVQLATLPLPPLTNLILEVGGINPVFREPTFLLIQIIPWVLILMTRECIRKVRETSLSWVKLLAAAVLANQLAFVTGLLGLFDGLKVIQRAKIGEAEVPSLLGISLQISILLMLLLGLVLKLARMYSARTKK